MRLKKNVTLLLVVMFSVFSVSTAFSASEQVIAGAGPSTKVVEVFAKEFSKLPASAGYKFSVPPKSAKHAGGIKNSDNYIFGRTGRPLNDKEMSMNKAEIFLARIPIVFVVGPDVNIKGLTIKQIEDIFTGKISNWKDVGGPDKDIFVIGREATEALFSILKKEYPAFGNSSFDKLLKKDHLVVKMMHLNQGKYAIAFGAKPNYDELAENILKVEGFSIGVEVGLVYDLKNKNHKLVKAAKDYAKGKQWAASVRSMGLLPPKQ